MRGEWGGKLNRFALSARPLRWAPYCPPGLSSHCGAGNSMARSAPAAARGDFGGRLPLTALTRVVEPQWSRALRRNKSVLVERVQATSGGASRATRSEWESSRRAVECAPSRRRSPRAAPVGRISIAATPQNSLELLEKPQASLCNRPKPLAN